MPGDVLYSRLRLCLVGARQVMECDCFGRHVGQRTSHRNCLGTKVRPYLSPRKSAMDAVSQRGCSVHLPGVAGYVPQPRP
jgi:hypothetical protein